LVFQARSMALAVCSPNARICEVVGPAK
jgi:hypothetical protein